MPPQQPSKTPDFIPAEPDFIPAEDQSLPDPEAAALHAKAGYSTGIGSPPVQPTFGSRLAETLGIPTSVDQLKRMFVPSAQDVKDTLLAGPMGPTLLNAGRQAIAETKQGQSPLNTIPKMILTGPLAPIGGQGVENLAEDVAKKMQPGQIVPRPSAFLQGPAMGDLAGTALNLLTADRGGGPTAETRLNKLTTAAGAKGSTAIENTLNTLLDTAKKEGIKVDKVEDFLKVVRKAKDNMNAEYGNALGPYAKLQISGQPVSTAIMSLITPDMYMTREGKAEIAAIKNAALEYQKPWPLGALDSKRSRLAADLSTHNAKEPVGRYTAEKGNLNLAIDNKILDALRDTVYPEADRLAGKPAGYFETMKSQQANLIGLESILNRRIENLMGKAREEKGQNPLSRIRGGAAVSGEMVPHGYISGLSNSIAPRDVMKQANVAARKGFSTGAPVSKALVMSYPARVLALNQNEPQQ